MLEPSPPRTESALKVPVSQVVVLGMHRSGTSAITSLLRLMGLWAGEENDFPPADDHNRAGYWEHRGVWSVDEAILQALGASWCEIADLDLSRLDEGSRARFRELAREIVRDLDLHGSWVIKDPRLCLLFPFWREILERPFCLLIYREPLPVARSLATRDGFPVPFGIALWEHYTREALTSTRGLPRVLISHRELMADPVTTLHRLYRHLVQYGPELARLRVPAAEEIRAVLDPTLVHHPNEPDLERLYLTPPQLGLLYALQDGSALDLDPVPPLSQGARDLLAAYQSLLATIRHWRETAKSVERYAKSLLQENEQKEGLRAGAERYAQSLEAERDRLQQTRQRIDAEHQNFLAEHQSLLAEHQNLLAARAADAADLQRALTWLDELDAIDSTILNSRSWKIGRVITTIGGLLRGSQTSGLERRERLMAKVRSWRRDTRQ